MAAPRVGLCLRWALAAALAADRWGACRWKRTIVVDETAYGGATGVVDVEPTLPSVGNTLVEPMLPSVGDTLVEPMLPSVGDTLVEPTLPRMGDTLAVGTDVSGLTPRLPISVDPNGIPVLGSPPGAVGDVDVGVEDAATLLEPEPHIPERPEVSIIAEVVPADVAGDAAVASTDAPVAGVADPIAIPPPS